ncbi:MAG: amidohydrolase family protein [Asgard group archaeon]|nr:amidohydrolase family protein [Asgard group archaeon]
MDSVIINTWLLTFQDKGLGIIKNGAVGIEDDRIVYVGKTEKLDYKSADNIIDGKRKVTMPGLINAHTHTGLTLLRGGAQDLPEIEWMNKGLGPFAQKMTKEDFICGSKLGVLEGLRTGSTTFAEYTSKVDELIEEVYKPFKVRAVGTETINEISPNRSHLKPQDIYEFTKEKGEKEFKHAREIFKKYRNEKLISIMFGPQALDMISLPLLQSIRNIAKDWGTKIHMHVAQGRRERLQIQERYGEEASTIKVLKNKGLLDENLIAAHIHDTTHKERKTLVNKNVKMVGCPSSISMIDGMIPPIADYLELGGESGIGTDQAPGPGIHNLFCEMRTISILSKTLHHDPTILPPWETLGLSTIQGAKVLGLYNKIGTIQEGKQADIITIDLNRLNLTPIIDQPFHNFIPNIIYSSSGYEVTDVFIAGEQIMKNGEFSEINQTEIIKEGNRRAKRIFAEATVNWEKAGSKLVQKVQEGYL